jgi:hypothetical protein
MQAFIRDELRQVDRELQVIETHSAPPIGAFAELASGEPRGGIERVLSDCAADLLLWGEVKGGIRQLWGNGDRPHTGILRHLRL